jgi:hypothetical protein
MFAHDDRYLLENWKLADSANRNPKDGSVLLTSGARSVSGFMINENEITSPEELEIVFDVSIYGGPSNPGEGMVFAFSESKDIKGGNFFGLDHLKFRGLAIVFDSNDNDQLGNNPSVAAHIITDKKMYTFENDGISNQLAGCIADYRNRAHEVKTKITYSKSNLKRLSLFMDLKGKGTFQRCFQVENVEFAADKYYLAFGALNNIPGKQTFAHDAHKISAVSVSFGRAVNDEPVAEQISEEDESIELQTVDAIAHEKLDLLIKNADKAVDSELLGRALDEIEINIVRHLNNHFNNLENSLSKLNDRDIGIKDSIQALRSVDLPKFQASLSDVRRIASSSSNDNANLDDLKLKQFKRDLERMIDSKMNILKSDLSREILNSSKDKTYVWAIVGLLQVLFALFFVLKHVSTLRRHEKLF